MTRNQRKQRHDEIVWTAGVIAAFAVIVLFAVSFMEALAMAAW